MPRHTKNEQTSDDKKSSEPIFSLSFSNHARPLPPLFPLYLSLSGIFVVCLWVKPNELYREQCSVSMTSINFNENMSSNKIVIIYFEMTCQFERFEYAFRYASFEILWNYA